LITIVDLIVSKIESTSYLHTYIGVEKRNIIDFHT
jgi:hypothetical protein